MLISIQKSNQLKSIAILMMLFLHLFNRKFEGLFQPLLFIGSQPLSYYISLFSDACVPIFAFVSGYGLYFKYKQNPDNYFEANISRLKKLYIHYWIILLVFAVIIGFFLKVDGLPGSISKFLLNFTALDASYNGAWWFLTTYILFVLSSSIWFRVLDKINLYLFLGFLLAVYFISFYLMTYTSIDYDNQFLNISANQTIRYFFTLFQFMLGCLALKYDWLLKIKKLSSNIRNRNFWFMLGIILLFIVHGTIPNSIIAPFIGLPFIFIFLQLDTKPLLNKILDYLTPHSTNLWLIHMFIYSVFFKDFIYSFRLVPIIFLVLLIVCLLSSYIINYLNSRIQTILLK